MELRILGPIQVRRADRTSVEQHEWRTAKTLDLLRLLALSNGEPVSTMSVIDKLWPDVDEARGRASLRTAASQLRKVLADECIERRGGALVLEGAWVDAHAYESLLAEVESSRRLGDHSRTVGLVQQAEALYVGDIEVPDTSGDWLHEPRRRYRDLRCRALLDAADAAAALCWMRDSLEFARRAAELDMSEESGRALMRALGAVGEVEKALEVYDQIQRTLVERYGVDPSPQTRALHLQLLTGTAVRNRQLGRGCHVGHESRVDELAMTISSMLRDDAGVGIVWFQAEPGSGRHSAVKAACRQVGLSLHDMGQDPWMQGPASGSLGGWEMPDVDVVLMPRAETVPAHAMKMLLALAQQQGGVLVVPVRQAPGTAASGKVIQQVLTLPPLTEDETAELAEVVLQGMPAPRLVHVLWTESGGRSGVACRLARTWLSDGRIVWSVDGLELAPPAPVHERAVSSGPVRRRLRLLSAFAEDVVHVIAVAGDELDAGEVASIVLALHRGGSATDVRSAMDQLVDSGLVRVGDRGYDLQPGVDRVELVAWMRPHLRQEINRIIAEQVSLPLPRRLKHLIAAGQHQRASVLGLAALNQAQVAGAEGMVHELVPVLMELPAHLRRHAPLLDQAPARGPEGGAGRLRGPRRLVGRRGGEHDWYDAFEPGSGGA